MTIGIDFIGVSKDRPCQLDALLRSMEKHCKIPHTINITYRYTEEMYREGYEIVKKNHPTVRFKERGVLKEDFQFFFDTTTNPYVAFTVDDIIWKHNFDEVFSLDLFEKENAVCLSLRLGSHTDFCYPVNQYYGVPKLINIKDNLFKYERNCGIPDFTHAMILDTNIYKRSEYLPYFQTLETYTNPNEFEGRMYVGPCVDRPYVLCFDQAKLVNVILNRVQSYVNNRYTNIHDPVYLNTMFLEGYKIDTDDVSTINNNSCHYEYKVKLIKNG